jgi:hypothetical protein
MDDCVEADVGFVGAHSDALELLELAEEVLDQMTPFVDLGVEWQRLVRRGCCEMTILAPRSLRSAMMALLSKALSAMRASQQRPSVSVARRGCRSDDRAGERNGPDCRGEREDRGGHAALAAADGLALSPFCALAVAMDLEDGGVDHGVFHVGPSEQASKNMMKTPALTQSRYRLKAVFQLPKKAPCPCP